MKLRAGRVVECCGQNLMMNSYARLELRNAERNTDSVSPVHEVSEKKKAGALLGPGIGVICVILYKIWLDCVHALKFFMKLNSKITG